MPRPYTKADARTMAARSRSLGLALVATTAGLMALGAARADDGPAAPPADPLAGGAAWSRILGNTITGTTPDGAYAEFFAGDGTLRIKDADGTAGGHWSLRAEQLCTQVDDDEEECRAMTVSGTSGTFTDEAGSLYRFDILPGNAKGL